MPRSRKQHVDVCPEQKLAKFKASSLYQSESPSFCRNNRGGAYHRHADQIIHVSTSWFYTAYRNSDNSGF